MRKILLTLAFVAGITTLNANTNYEITDPELECHMEACAFVGFIEDGGEILNEEAAEAYYDQVFNDCMGL